MDDLVSILGVAQSGVAVGWIEGLTRADIVNAGLALGHMGAKTGYLEQGFDAEGQQKMLFGLRDVFASGFRSRAVAFVLMKILRKLAAMSHWW